MLVLYMLMILGPPTSPRTYTLLPYSTLVLSDQAALAAATQLDGKTGACSRAANAASALIRNDARFANDGNASGLAITVANEATCDRTGFIKFYKNKDRSDTGTLADADVNFVEVTVNSRTARFSLTPVVEMFSSGDRKSTRLDSSH